MPMRSIRIHKEWNRKHPEIEVKHHRTVKGTVIDDYDFPDYDYYWLEVKKQLTTIKPTGTELLGINTNEDISFLNSFNWAFAQAFSTTVPHTNGALIIYAYEKYKTE